MGCGGTGFIWIGTSALRTSFNKWPRRWVPFPQAYLGAFADLPKTARLLTVPPFAEVYADSLVPKLRKNLFQYSAIEAVTDQVLQQAAEQGR